MGWEGGGVSSGASGHTDYMPLTVTATQTGNGGEVEGAKLWVCSASTIHVTQNFGYANGKKKM